MNSPKPADGKQCPLAQLIHICLALTLALPAAGLGAEPIPAPGSKLPPASSDKVITAADVAVERVGTNIPASAIGDPPR